MSGQAPGRGRDQEGDQPVGAGHADERDGDAAQRRPEDAAGLADAALVRHALHRLLARDDLRLERGVGGSLEAGGDPGDEDDGEDRHEAEAAVERDQRERDRAQRHEPAGGHDDRAPVVQVGQVAAEERQGERGDRLDQPEPAERERVAW